jgi:hypothetical protein
MRILLALLAVAAVTTTSRAADADRSLVIVVAKGSKITSLSRGELKRAFAGDTLVVNGARLAPFNYPAGTPERIAFDRVILGMSAEQVGRYWVDRKIRGDSQAPRSLPSALHVTKIVAKFPSAISYVPADQVTADLVPVAIDGVLPTATGYPIKLK